MNRDQKAAVIDEIAAQIKESEAVFAVDYRGISVPRAAELRARLRDADATFRIVKNSLTERAADKVGAADLKSLLEGPTAFAFVRGDAALAAKALSDFGRGTDILAFKGGLLNGEGLSPDQIVAIARLPAREVLYAQLVGTVAAPLNGLVRGLGGMIAGLARQLQQIADQGLVSGEAPTTAEELSSPVDESPAEVAPDEAPAEEEGQAPPADEGPPPEQVPDEPAEEAEEPGAEAPETEEAADASADAEKTE